MAPQFPTYAGGLGVFMAFQPEICRPLLLPYFKSTRERQPRPKLTNSLTDSYASSLTIGDLFQLGQPRARLRIAGGAIVTPR